MDPEAWKQMVRRTRELERSMGSFIKKVEPNESTTVVLQRRSARVKNSLPAGHIIKDSDIEYLRPCPSDGISPTDSSRIIGATVIIPLMKGEQLKWNHLQLQ